MAAKPMQLHRDFYSIAEAAKILERELEDLLFLAATSKLPLYVIASNWEPGLIKETDRIFDVSKPPRPLTAADDIDPLVTIKLGDGKSTTYQYNRANYDFDLGPIRVVSKTGGFQAFYSLNLSGPQLISVDCVRRFRNKAPDIKIEIDLSHYLKLPEDYPVIYQCTPTNMLLLNTAIDSGLVVVMATDIQTQISGGNKEGIVDYYDDPRWPLELDIAIQAWNAVRKTIKDGQKPGAELRKWLENHPSRLAKAQIERIATVANWDKGPGAPKKEQE